MNVNPLYVGGMKALNLRGIFYISCLNHRCNPLFFGPYFVIGVYMTIPIAF